jgi:hypothetical protein
VVLELKLLYAGIYSHPFHPRFVQNGPLLAMLNNLDWQHRDATTKTVQFETASRDFCAAPRKRRTLRSSRQTCSASKSFEVNDTAQVGKLGLFHLVDLLHKAAAKELPDSSDFSTITAICGPSQKQHVSMPCSSPWETKECYLVADYSSPKLHDHTWRPSLYFSWAAA